MKRNRNNSIYITFIFYFFSLVKGSLYSQNTDTIYFNSLCLSNSKEKLQHKILYKKIAADTYVLNFYTGNSANDTLIFRNSKIYSKKVSPDAVLFEFDNSKFKNYILTNSGLGFHVYYIGKQKTDGIWYDKFGFYDLISDTPVISELTISRKFEIISFVYFNGEVHFKFTRK